jgi:hypothetical protein
VDTPVCRAAAKAVGADGFVNKLTPDAQLLNQISALFN